MTNIIVNKCNFLLFLTHLTETPLSRQAGQALWHRTRPAEVVQSTSLIAKGQPWSAPVWSCTRRSGRRTRYLAQWVNWLETVRRPEKRRRASDPRTEIPPPEGPEFVLERGMFGAKVRFLMGCWGCARQSRAAKENPARSGLYFLKRNS